MFLSVIRATKELQKGDLSCMIDERVNIEAGNGQGLEQVWRAQNHWGWVMDKY